MTHEEETLIRMVISDTEWCKQYDYSMGTKCCPCCGAHEYSKKYGQTGQHHPHCAIMKLKVILDKE